MQWPRFDSSLEPRVQLVVQRPGALHRRDVLRHTCKVDRRMVGDTECAGQMLCEVAGAVEPDHGDDAASEESFHDLGIHVVGSSVAVPRQTRVLPKNRAVQPAELFARLDAEIIDEASSRRLIGVERLRLASSAVEREHQELPLGFPKGMLDHERFELGDHISGASALDVRIDPLLESDEMKLLESVDLTLRERLERELGERSTTPHLECLAQKSGTLLRCRAAGGGKRALESCGIDLVARYR